MAAPRLPARSLGAQIDSRKAVAAEQGHGGARSLREEGRPRHRRRKRHRPRHGTVLCTGGAAGVYRADCLEDRLDRVADEITAFGGAPRRIAADLAEVAECGWEVREAYEDAGRPDIVISNAAAWSEEPFLDVQDASWRRVIAVNLMASFVAGQRVARAMVGRRLRLPRTLHDAPGSRHPARLSWRYIPPDAACWEVSVLLNFGRADAGAGLCASLTQNLAELLGGLHVPGACPRLPAFFA